MLYYVWISNSTLSIRKARFSKLAKHDKVEVQVIYNDFFRVVCFFRTYSRFAALALL
jgi:hypothetical protein